MVKNEQMTKVSSLIFLYWLNLLSVQIKVISDIICPCGIITSGVRIKIRHGIAAGYTSSYAVESSSTIPTPIYHSQWHHYSARRLEH